MNTNKILKSDNGIFNLLLIKLYTRQLKPGEKLPPLRAFAKELGVDPASLRIALKQLEMMNLLDIRRSDGVYIQDFKETGGLDFLTTLFSIKEIQENKTILDSFLVDEIMAFWTATYPEIMFMASLRYSSLDLKRFLEILNSQIAHIDNIEKLIELDILAQELVGKLANNLMVSLFLNSVTPMLQKMTDVLYRNLSRESRLHFLQVKKEGVCRLMNGTLDLRVSTEKFRNEMEKCRKEIRKSIAEDMFDLQP
ncbi:MAG: GntR family transcriptional regulator [Proteobacteria bacterium]|nr:GntR family transcriptional regulator [Pseudomonadota bacterium]MBU1583180.1 GntR family transcriptional regulator [Pseudomonadota bacterium]MBU2454592.1 GntR family transcriptional regulator [Pseudomonadota bacterium]MBU2631557.1 GntR family transcriptional regulator [Pseudomonadota bacterium]